MWWRDPRLVIGDERYMIDENANGAWAQHNSGRVENEGVFDMLGISSSWFAMRGVSIKESVEHGFEMGFELVELGAAHKYEDNAVETVMELRKKYPDKKFTLHALFPPVKIKTPNGRKNSGNHQYTMNLADVKEHEAILKIVKKMMDISDLINAEIIGIHGGYAGEVRWTEGEFGFEELVMKKPIEIETAKRNVKIILEELVSMAEERAIKIAVEISPPGDFAPIMVDAEAFDWMFSNFKSKYLGVLLDVGHLHLAGRAEGYSPYEFVKKFKNKIFELHLHDSKEDKAHFAVGTGEIDFEKYFKIIGRSKLQKMPLVFEYNNAVTDQQALNGKALIEKMLKNL